MYLRREKVFDKYLSINAACSSIMFKINNALKEIYFALWADYGQYYGEK